MSSTGVSITSTRFQPTTADVKKKKAQSATKSLIDRLTQPFEERNVKIDKNTSTTATMKLLDTLLQPIEGVTVHQKSASQRVVEQMLHQFENEKKSAATPRARLRQKVRRETARRKRREKMELRKKIDVKILVDTPEQLQELLRNTNQVRSRFEQAINSAVLQKIEKELEDENLQATDTAAGADATTVAGTATGYWKSFSQNWAVGTVFNISVSLGVTAVGSAAAAYFGVSPDIATPLLNVTSTLVANLSVSVLRHSTSIVTDPKTGLKSVARDFVGSCSGAIAGEAMSNSVIGTFGGRIAGQIIGEKVNAIVFGRIEPSQERNLTSGLLQSNSILSKAQKAAALERQKREGEFLRKVQSESAAAPNSKEALRSKLFIWKKMRQPILFASAATAIAVAATAFGPEVFAKSGTAAGKYVLDYLTEFATSGDVRAEALRAAYNHPFLGPIIKQSILRRLPLQKLDNATEFATRKILQVAQVQKIDETTRRVLKNHVRESILRELMLEDILVRVAQETARQTTLRVAEKSVETVHSNWDSIEEALSDLKAGASESAAYVRQRLQKFGAGTKPDTLQQVLGESVVSGAASMAKNEAERVENASESAQREHMQAERAQEWQMKRQARLARRLRDERVAQRIAARQEASVDQAEQINLARAAQQQLQQRAAEKFTTRQLESMKQAEEINAARAARLQLEQRAAKRVSQRQQDSELRRAQMNQAARESFKEQLLQDRDVIMQQVWDENFSDSTFNFLKDVDAPSAARLAAEAYGLGALARGAQLGRVATKVVQAAPTVVETALSGAEMLRTVTSIARVAAAKDIAKDNREGSRARFVRDLDNALEQLPAADSVTREALLQQLKQTAGIHDTVVGGFDVDKATSWSARDAVIKMLGLEPGKEYQQQLGELAGDVGFGRSLNSAIQNVVGSLFRNDKPGQ